VSLAERVAALEKRIKNDIIASTDPKPRPHVSSGSILVDAALGIGGIPEDGITEIAGHFSSGKTTLALEAIREIQERPTKNVAVFIDHEHALDIKYAKQLGVDVKCFTKGGKFLWLKPDCLEEGADAGVDLIQDPEVGIIAVDSVAAMIPKKKMIDPSNAEIGLQARLLAPFFASMAQFAETNKTPVILLNQVRIKLEGSGRFMKAVEDSSGGNALKFYALVRLWLKQGERIMEPGLNPMTGEKEPIRVGQYVWAETIKSKIAPPFRRVRFVIRYGTGVDNVQSIVDLGKAQGLIKSARGGSFEYLGDSGFKCKGLPKFKEELETRPGVLAEIMERLDLDSLWD